MRTRLLVVWLTVFALVLSWPGYTGPAQREPNLGVSIYTEMEAITVSSKQIRSDAWKNLVSWLPYIGFLFSLSGREVVIQHDRALSGSFLGLPVKGQLVVLEIRKYGYAVTPTARFVPARITVDLPNGTLVMNATATEGVYRFESDSQQNSGVFRGVLVRAELRIFGISDVNSLVRGEFTIGFDSVEKLAEVLSENLPDQDALRVKEQIKTGRVVLMPFPVYPKPPEDTYIRWMVVGNAQDEVRGQVRILVGGPTSQEKRAYRLKVVAIPAGGTPSVIYSNMHQPGDQVELIVRGTSPVVVMIFIDANLVQEFKLQ